MTIRGIFHYLRRLTIIVSKTLLVIVPKDKNLILFSAWFGQKYADSPMYMYEYILGKGIFKPVWFTRNREVYNKLKEQNTPVILAGTIKAAWYLIRAKMFVSSIQFSDFPPYTLTNCIYFDLDHGFQVKEGPELTKNQRSYIDLLRKNVDYYHSASSYFCMTKVSSYYRVAPERVALVNKPRTDVLFDPALRSGYNEIIDELKKGGKAIVWMPTHRSDGQATMDVSKLLDLDGIQKICEENDAVFLIKKHFYHKHERSDLEGYTRIFDITNEDIETQTLLFQADVLVSDYSSCYIDYLPLDRPIVLYAYDLEDYLAKERNIFIPFSENHVGELVKTPETLNHALRNVCTDWKDLSHREGREEIRRKFFSDKLVMGKGREEVLMVIKSMLNKEFSITWAN